MDVALWRSVPIAEAETVVNLPEVRRGVLEHLYDDDAELDLPAAATDIQDGFEQEKRTLRKLRLGKPVAAGRRYPDEHYRRVAEAYLAAVSSGGAPNQMIAVANGVPVTTVRRWVAEARRRGFLSPAQGAGRAG
jgi:hypothetical protein